MAADKPDVVLTIPLSRPLYTRLMIEANMLNRPAGEVVAAIVETAFTSGDYAMLYAAYAAHCFSPVASASHPLPKHEEE